MRSIARFGVPAVLTTDRGSQFTSILFRKLTNMFGIIHRPTTAYNPNRAVDQSFGYFDRKAAFRMQCRRSILPAILHLECVHQSTTTVIPRPKWLMELRSDCLAMFCRIFSPQENAPEIVASYVIFYVIFRQTNRKPTSAALGCQTH